MAEHAPTPSTAPPAAVAPDGPARPRVLVAAVVPRRRAPALALLEQLIRDGGSAVLVTADGTRAGDVPAGIEVIDLAVTEQRVGLHPLLTRSPVRIVRRLVGRPRSGPTRAWSRYRVSRPYKAIRGWVMWRALRRHLDAVRVAELDHVILVDIQSWPIAWQLHHRNPAITIGWDVPAELFERVGRPPASG